MIITTMALSGKLYFLWVSLYILVSAKTALSHMEFNDDLILNLIDKVESMQEKVNKLEKNNRDLKQSISVLIGSTAQFRLQIQELTNRVTKCENKGADTNVVQLEEDNKDASDINNDDNSYTERMQKVVNGNINDKVEGVGHKDCRRNVDGKGKRQTTENVAFTAYLDHVTRTLGKNQPVVYNQIILNDGGAYSDKTGIFRVPVSGVYLLSWAVTARKLPGEHAYDVWVKLVVNGAHQTGAVAESRSDGDDNQGSNSAVIRLNQGDEVWTSHYASYPDIYGDDNERTTSFMGVLLYVDQ